MGSQPSIKQDEVIQVKRNPWADNFFRPLVIITMIMCLNLAVVQLVRLANPSWSGVYFLVGMLLTTVEAVYSFRVIASFRKSGGSMLRFRLVELALLIIMLKLLSFMGKPWTVVSAELWSIWQEPSTFLTTEFYVVLTLALSAWAATTFTMADIELLYDPYVDNRSTLDSLAERFFWGGGLLVLISGVTHWIARAGVNSLVNFNRPSLSGVILNVLVYFTLGLVLLSQVNLTRLLVRWRIQRIAVEAGLAKQWAKYGLLFLGVVTLIAFALPTSYSLGLLETVGYGLHVIMNVLIFAFQLLIVLISLPVVLLLSWLGFNPPNPLNSLTQAAPPPPPPPTGSSPPWLELVRSVAFWLVALAALAYLIKTYLDDRPELVAQIRAFKPVALLLWLLRQVGALLNRWRRAGLELLPARLNLGAMGDKLAAHRRAGHLPGWRRLSPRERILSYYFNILQQAAKRGQERRQGQTPYEYEPNLSQSAPEVELEIHELTDVFVHARYSQVEFNERDAASVRKQWQQIKKSLRQRREGSRGARAQGAGESGNSNNSP